MIRKVAMEDCLETIDNRYQVVLIASKRASSLAEGLPTLLEKKQYDMHDKPSILAIREIAEKCLPCSNVAEYKKWERNVQDKLFFDNYNNSHSDEEIRQGLTSQIHQRSNLDINL